MRPRRIRCRPANTRQRTERLRGAHHHIRLAKCQQPLRHRLNLLAHIPAQPFRLLRRRRLFIKELAGQATGAQRNRHCRIRQGIRARGELERPTPNIKIQDAPRTPPLPAAHREIGDSGLLIARNLAQTHAGLQPHILQNLGAITGLTNSGGRKGEQVFGVILNGEIARRLHELGQRGAAFIRNIARRCQILHQLQRDLMRGVRLGAGARVAVKQQQVNSI